MRWLVWKVTVVVLAGLVGAVLFHLLGVLSGALYAMSDEAGPFAQVLLQALMFLQLFISGLVGHERSALFVYAVFGAVPFMLLAASGNSSGDHSGNCTKGITESIKQEPKV
jgi:hypothetical protein